MGHRAFLDKRRHHAWVTLALLTTACGGFFTRGDDPPRERTPRVLASEPIDLSAARAVVDLDSLASAFAVRADTTAAYALPALDDEIRDWLARLEFGDPALLPLDVVDPREFLRRTRGRLLDSLGWSAFRRGDLRQAEAALVSAVDEINSRGTTSGYAHHFHHLGDVHVARGRWAQAVDAYLAAEVRGMGEAATPALERAYRRRYGSLRGLEDRRVRELARVEDERRQRLVEGAEFRSLPSFTWPGRTGTPLSSAELVGRPTVLAVWGEECSGCAGYGDRLAPLAEALGARGAVLVAIWVGSDPALAGSPSPYMLLIPPDPAEARRALRVARMPALLVVDARGRIRYRHTGPAAIPPPVGDIVIQLDHLRRVVP